MDPASGSSSEPILVENIPAQENLVDNQVAQLPEDNQRQQSSRIIAPNVNAVPPAKRKLDFSRRMRIVAQPLHLSPAAPLMMKILISLLLVLNILKMKMKMIQPLRLSL